MAFSKSLLDFFLGALLITIGVILVKEDHFKIPQIVKFASNRDELLLTLMGWAWIIYGIWRIVRGYLKLKN